MNNINLDKLAQMNSTIGGFQDIKKILKQKQKQSQQEGVQKLHEGKIEQFLNQTIDQTPKIKPKKQMNMTIDLDLINKNDLIISDTPKYKPQIVSFKEGDDHSKFGCTTRSNFKQTFENLKQNQRQSQHSKQSLSLQIHSQNKFFTPSTPKEMQTDFKKSKGTSHSRFGNMSFGGDIFSPTVPQGQGQFTPFKDIIQKNPQNILDKFFNQNLSSQEKIKQKLIHNSEQMNLIKDQLEIQRISSFENYISIKKYSDSLINKSATQKKLPQQNNYSRLNKFPFNSQQMPLIINPAIFNQQLQNNQQLGGNSQFSNTEIEEQGDSNQNQQIELQFHWEKVVNYSSQLKPEFREGASLLEYNQNLYLFGGFGFQLFNSLYQFSLKDYEWKKTETNGFYGNQSGRFGHSANLYKNQMVIFGGASEYSSKLKNRAVMNDVWMLNLDNHEWKQIRTIGDYVEPRRNHATCIVGNHFYAHGGVGNYEKYLNQLNVLSLDKGRWKSFQFKFDEQGIAFHQMVPIFQKSLKFISRKAEKMGKMVSSKNKFKVKEEGIYCFGGKQGNQKIRGKLIILKLDQKEQPVDWIIPETSGQSPHPRFHHSMIFNYYVKGIVLFGGVNDEANMPEYAFQDVWILQLNNLNWIQINVSGQNNRHRFAHSFTSIDERIFIFGGASNQSYTDCELYVLEMNQQVAKQKKSNPVRDFATRQMSLDRLEVEENKHISYLERKINFSNTNRSSENKSFLRPPSKKFLKSQPESMFISLDSSRKNQMQTSNSPQSCALSPRQKQEMAQRPKLQSLFSHYLS
ncbi:kelch motif protein (macronuclear) [Tetrahymena thermophila SB210]|uniref:Kelch motif protein n=1 Tax=Tetrahymena thermophila (strain SB210) TaxID=312017 RepID=Q22AR9_TETTS|nr:kelch motif protein [Tetrahymena thermophila SB210]EAR82399.2 kelch motif protein [Tetrahymena thermophila SB210]|eukprot:XP_001030062.2 kelch motif protein [Tetrahymena thermophila SB210]